MFDTNLYTINQIKGTERENLPGLIVFNPPHRAARGREGDILILLLALSGETSMTAEHLQDWLNKKGEAFYKTSGTVTLAMKGMVDLINRELLDRNLKRAKTGNQVCATLNMAVLHKDSVYFLNIGTTRTFFINKEESIEVNDVENHMRGLGVSQTLTYRFIQKTITNNDTIIFAPISLPSWSADTFKGSTMLSIDALGRRVFNQSGLDLKTVVIRVNEGKGLVSIAPLRKSSSFRQSETAGTEKHVPESRKPERLKKPISEPPKPDSMNVPLEPQPAVNDDQKKAEVVPEKTEVKTSTDENHLDYPEKPNPAPDSSSSSSPAQEEAQVKPEETRENASSDVNRVKASVVNSMKKVFPKTTGESVQFTRTTLILIAIAVPILVVMIAGSVYVNRGKSQQFNLYLLQAQEYAIQAEAQINDEPSRLANLQQALFWLDKAEEFGQSDSSESLRLHVQDDLDTIQGVERLEFIPVVEGGLSIGVSVSKIVATNTDLYLLDAASGTVLRYYLSGSIYTKDEAFDCGPNPKSTVNSIDSIVDMVPINVNNTFKATLLAIDETGNIEYCIPEKSGMIGALTPPDQGWFQIKSISLNNGYLYILDPGGNAVYRYAGSNNQFDEKPSLFFDNVIPSLKEAFEIEVNDDELYILRTDGQMVECTYSHLKDYKLTECIEPAPYGDMRTGDVPETISFPEAQFIQMTMTEAPDSSIYLLDANGKALYHFSLQRNLQKVMHPRLTDGLNLKNLTPTAFSVSSSRMVFMAFNNQVYYASLP